MADQWNKEPILVVVADKSPIHSKLLAQALNRNPHIQVVGAVSSADELLAIAAKVLIHVVVIDCNLHDDPSHGFKVLRELQLLRPAVRGIMLLDPGNREAVVGAFQAGAKGIFSKHGSQAMLCRCIRCVHEGQIWASSRDLAFALEALATTHSVRAINAKGMSLLSKRETQVVQALAEGLTNREIGQQLKLSPHTVKNYLLRIFDKLGVSNRVELLFFTLSTPAGTGGTQPNGGSQGAKTLAAAGRLSTATPAVVPMIQGNLATLSNKKPEIPLDLTSAYTWCIVSERTNLGGARDQITALRKKIAESMTTEQILTAEYKAVDWSKQVDSRKPPSFTASGDGDVSKEPATACSAD